MEEERVYTYSEIVARLRRKLLEYFGGIAESLRGEDLVGAKLASIKPGSCMACQGGVFERIGVVDGGSGVIALNVGYVGIVSAVGVVIENNRVVERVVVEPYVIPEDPGELYLFESLSLVESVIDKAREALVFETAKRVVERDVDLLVVDGPLVPYGALAKIVTESTAEKRAWLKYKKAVLELYEQVSRLGTYAVGFVKRPRSRYIARLYGLKGFDHVLLSRILRPGEYFPSPPIDLGAYSHLFHEPEVAEIISEMRPRVTYLRLTSSTPPSRVDLSSSVLDHGVVLAYIFGTRTREGMPFVIMKADEEAKITRKLIKELYDDVLHEYVVKYVKNRPELLVPLLPEYGGL